MRSMTGFGVGEGALLGGRLTLELRALNHRFLEIRVRLPSELGEHAFFLEQQARERLTRGRFEIGVRVSGPVFPPPRFSLERARAVYQGLKALAEELAPGTPLPVTSITALPDLLLESTQAGTDDVRKALVEAFDVAERHLDGMRLREGQSLKGVLQRHLRQCRALCDSIAAQSQTAVSASQNRLRERIERLVQSATLDGPRLETEIALLAEKADIAEELARLSSHFDQFEHLLGQAEPVGRRLEFLLQEMTREANTIGSKSQDAELAHVVVAMKAEIERIREQVQNVE